jgi:multidrug efflux pump subunit AcrA (membrane-fusion protein)
MAHISGKKVSKRFVVIAATAILAAALVFIPSILAEDAEKPLAAETEETPVFSVKVTDARIRTLRSKLEVNGDIVSGRQVTVFPEISGKLASLRVALGSVVRQGELIAQVDPSRPGLQYLMNPVYAPISGTVSATPIVVGSTVNQNDSIVTISVTENLQIEALIPEREVSQLKAGLKADVTLQAWPGEIFTATVAQVAPVLDPVSRTKKIVLTFDEQQVRNDSRISAGMFARVSLVTGTYADIVTVPAEAIINHFGIQAVYVLQNGAGGLPRVFLREVSTGVTIDALTEIKTGIAAGEKVIIQGQQFIADGAVVRIIGSVALSTGNGAIPKGNAL